MTFLQREVFTWRAGPALETTFNFLVKTTGFALNSSEDTVKLLPSHTHIHPCSYTAIAFLEVEGERGREK